ncbi:MAG: integration host factor subunit alpha [Polyangiales bacterium]
MTKAEIIDNLCDKVPNVSRKEAAEVVETLIETMKEVLASGEKIKISGFGNFEVRYKKARMGRDPQTGHPEPISARRVVTFKTSQVLKSILNPERELQALAANSQRTPQQDAAPQDALPPDGQRLPSLFER